MELTSTMKSVAMQAESVEDLLRLAKECGYSVTREEAEEVYAELKMEGELSDEELENVAGGGCYSTDEPYRLIVTMGNKCDLYRQSTMTAYDWGTCSCCQHSRGNVPMYCDIRKKGDDPLA